MLGRAFAKGVVFLWTVVKVIIVMGLVFGLGMHVGLACRLSRGFRKHCPNVGPLGGLKKFCWGPVAIEGGSSSHQKLVGLLHLLLPP